MTIDDRVAELEKLDQAGKLDEFVQGWRAVIEQLDVQEEDYHGKLGFAHELLSYALSEMGEDFAAETERRKALEIYRMHDQGGSRRAVHCLWNLAMTLSWTGRPAEAEELLTEALKLVEELPESEQQDYGFILVELSRFAARDKQWREAERLVIAALHKHVKHHTRWSHAWAMAIHHLSGIYRQKNELHAAVRAGNMAIRSLQEAGYAKSSSYAWVLSQQGLVLADLKRNSEARALQVEALSVVERVRPMNRNFIDKVRHRLQKLDATQHTPS